MRFDNALAMAGAGALIVMPLAMPPGSRTIMMPMCGGGLRPLTLPGKRDEPPSPSACHALCMTREDGDHGDGADDGNNI